MTRARRRAHWIRRIILVAGIVYTLAALTWALLPLVLESAGSLLGNESQVAGLIGTPLCVPPFDMSATGYAANVGLIVGLLLLAQWTFLRPGRGFTMRLTDEGRPLKSAVVAAGALAMLLTVGGITLLLELPNWWEPLLDKHWGPAYVWAGMLAVWGLWTWLFFIYWRQGDRYTQLGRMIRGLMAGSLIEAFVAVPVHVWAVRQRECYCARGTYTTLVLAGTVLLWAFGPGIVLLYMRERYRHARLFPMCRKCGYNLTGNVSGTCPECGTEIKKP